MMSLASLMLSASLLSSFADSRCSPVIRPYDKPRGATTLWIKTARDSTFVGRELGQLYTAVKVDGPNKVAVNDGQQIVVVWWGLTSDCRRIRATSWTPLASGEGLIVPRLRPRADWIDSIPTFDMFGDYQYIPSRSRRETTTSSPLSVAEYWSLFVLVPERDASSDIAWRSWEDVVTWGAANIEKSRREPAASMMCFARARLDQIRRRDTTPPEFLRWSC